MNAEQTYRPGYSGAHRHFYQRPHGQDCRRRPRLAQLAAEGYEHIETNWRFAGAYDSAQRSYSLDEFSVDAPTVAALRLGGKLAEWTRPS